MRSNSNEVFSGALKQFPIIHYEGEIQFAELRHAEVKIRAGATCAEQEIMRRVNEKVSVFKSTGVDFVAERFKKITGEPRRLG